MPVANSRLGLKTEAGFEHIDGNTGELVYRAVSPKQPVLKCPRLSCIATYIVQSWIFALALIYEKRRQRYAYANRGKEILMRYRTGEPTPRTLWQVIFANLKITCPICRKFEIRRK